MLGEEDITMRYDIIIKNGNIFDGTGNPWIKADIGIVNDKVKRIGLIKDEGKRIIDADGLIVSPGFVDIHNHSDFKILAYPDCESNLMQGITTAVVGNCGFSMAPLNPNNLYLLKKYLSHVDKYNYNWNWTSFREFYQKVQETNIALNLAPLVGHGTIRIAVKGFDKSQPSEREMQEMKRLLAESLEDGAFGMSSGLTYPPGGYAEKEELHELGKILKKYRRVYCSHLRDYGDNIVKAIQEAIEMAQKNDIPVEISHLNLRKENWGKADNILKEIVKAREKGIEVGCDRYPYNASSGPITSTSFLPLWVLEGGVEKMLERLSDYSTRKKIKEELSEKKKNDTYFGVYKLKDVLVANSPLAKKYEGMSLEDIIGSSKGDKVYDHFFDFLLEIKGEGQNIVYFSRNEEDLKTTLSNEFTSVMTDSSAISISAGGNPHPRTYGSYPRFFQEYVNKQKILTMSEAIKKVTSQPASIIRLKARGLIKEGFYADIVIFDSAKIQDHATYQDPHQYPSGIHYVIVNGGIAVENGNKIGTNYGHVLYAT